MSPSVYLVDDFHLRLRGGRSHSLTPRFDPPLPSAFDHEGAKPDCYAEHAKLVPAVQDFMPPTSVVELARATPPLSDRANVYRIGPDTIVKVHEYYPCAEAFNLSMIRAMTTIPVPELRQVVKHKNDTYLVMEYLRGRTLARCWPALRSSERLRIAETLRGYIAQLRTLRRAVPGALDGSACNGPFFPPDGAGPFASYAEFVDWFNHKGDVAKSTGKAPSDLGTFDDASSLVFTHQDLSMRNILLANDGTVYLIDWEWSGFYPEWMEYACMARNQDTPQTWKDLIPFIAGSHQDMFELLCNVSWTIVVGRDM